MTSSATITSDVLAATISAHGAELQSLTDREGRQLLWGGDPAFWRGRAPILFPIIGLLNGGRYHLDGRSYAMPKHGFARHSVFDIVQSDRDAATFRLKASDETRAIYPLEFVLDINFAVEQATLKVSAAIANEGDTIMPASFGFHPALCWPLPYNFARANHRIEFESEEPAPVRRIDGNGLLRPDSERSPIVGKILTLRDELFFADALIFDQVQSRRVTYGAETGPQIAVGYADFPVLGVWTKPHAGFICIEPWHGLPDPEGFAEDIFLKPGIFEVAPGTTERLAMTIELVHPG